MRRQTVTYGIRLVSGGIAAVILATFFHEQLAALLLLSSGGELQFIFLGLLFGGILGFSGILVAVAGFLLASGRGPQPRILPSLVLLIVLVVLFFILIFLPFGASRQPPLRPGDTVII